MPKCTLHQSLNYATNSLITLSPDQTLRNLTNVLQIKPPTTQTKRTANLSCWESQNKNSSGSHLLQTVNIADES